MAVVEEGTHVQHQQLRRCVPGCHAGLPTSVGAPLLLPVDLSMSLVHRRSGLELQFKAPFLCVQLPLAAIPGLQSLGRAAAAAMVCCPRNFYKSRPFRLGAMVFLLKCFVVPASMIHLLLSQPGSPGSSHGTPGSAQGSEGSPDDPAGDLRSGVVSPAPNRAGSPGAATSFPGAFPFCSGPRCYCTGVLSHGIRASLHALRSSL